jgi:hypothetical protein
MFITSEFGALLYTITPVPRNEQDTEIVGRFDPYRRTDTC